MSEMILDETYLPVDAQLPQLSEVMDAENMKQHFQQFLDETISGNDWQVEQCKIGRIYYHPEEHCGITYKLALKGKSGEKREEWFYGKIYSPGIGENRYKRAVKKAKKSDIGHPFLKDLPAVLLWKKFNMILWVFPADPKILLLPKVIDSGFVSEYINPHIPKLINGEISIAAAANPKIDKISCIRIKHMPAKRCVLNFQIQFANGSAHRKPGSFYSKTYSDGMSRFHFRKQAAAYEALAENRGVLEVPKPLFHLDKLNTFWQDDWQGVALIEKIRDLEPQKIFARLGTAVADLHKCTIEELPDGPMPDDIMKTVEEDVALLGYHLPKHRDFADELFSLLIKNQMIPEGNTISVPIHGACRIEQFLVKKDRLAMVDFDALAMADPVSEIAEFIASLQFLEFTEDFPADWLKKGSDIFLESYANRVSWDVNNRALSWYVVAFLISKVYSTVKQCNFKALSRLDGSGFEIINRWTANLLT